jgi:L-alanine-DL-glutamate epimerase-like enolase superfamily enzyme
MASAGAPLGFTDLEQDIHQSERRRHSVFHPSWDSRPRPNYGTIIVRIDTDEGISGFGSGDRMAGFEGHEELFIGQDPLNLAHLYQIISNLSFHYGKHWPIDLALWDIIGKAKGKPVWKLLGGTDPKIRSYASLGQRRSREDTVSAVQDRMEEGFQAVKQPIWRAAMATALKTWLKFGIDQDLTKPIDWMNDGEAGAGSQ